MSHIEEAYPFQIGIKKLRKLGQKLSDRVNDAVIADKILREGQKEYSEGVGKALGYARTIEDKKKAHFSGVIHMLLKREELFDLVGKMKNTDVLYEEGSLINPVLARAERFRRNAADIVFGDYRSY